MHRPAAPRDRSRAAKAGSAANACLIAVAIAWASCGATPPGLVDGRLELPRSLREVSALVAVDQATIACVQDEAGVLFFVDLEGRRPVREEKFGPRGDYEGLALVDGEYWVLRSEGELLHLRKHDDRFRVGDSVALPAGFAEWEGLCFDAERRLLLVMPKRHAGGGEHHQRPVFAVDPATRRLLPDPVVTIDARSLAREGAPGTAPRLHCSDLLVLPGRGELLVLSAIDHMLARFDREGRLLGHRALDEDELPQPEGLALLPDGRLLVASEGGDRGVVEVVPLP